MAVLYNGTDAVGSADPNDTALVKRFIAGGIPHNYARIAANIMEKEGAALLSPKVQLHHHSRHAVWRACACTAYCAGLVDGVAVVSLTAYVDVYLITSLQQQSIFKFCCLFRIH